MSTLFNIGNKIATTTEALLPVQEATAGYSLRNIGIKGYNQPVVKVVRERDSAEEDFTASEVSDGTLVDWVNNVTTETFQPGDNALGDFYLTHFTRVSVSYPADNSSGHDGKVIKVTRNNVDPGSIAGVGVENLEPIVGQKIKVSFLYRSNVTFKLGNRTAAVGSLISSNTGNAIRYEKEIDWATVGHDDNVTFQWIQNDGDFFEISDFSVEYLTSNGLVKVWYDQFGDNNATQNTVSEMPKIVSFGALITENGKPALDMDNGIMSVSTITLSTMSLFFVYLRGLEDFVLTGNAAASRHRLQSSATRIYVNNIDYLTGLTDISQIQKLYTTIYSSGNLDIYENGSQNNFSSGGSFTGVTGNYIIDNIGDETNVKPSDGFMQELIIYDSDQSVNRTNIENNINSYYNIYS